MWGPRCSRPVVLSPVVVALVGTLLLALGVSIGRYGTPAVPLTGGDMGAAVATAQTTVADGAALLDLPPSIKRLHINVGPNISPLKPPADPETAVLCVEAQLEVASMLREKYARQYPDRFWVIPAAMAGERQAGFGSFRMYNKHGASGSLATIHDADAWAARDRGLDRIGRGVEYVPVLSLARLLAAVPPSVDIPLLVTDTQGFDFSVIASAGPLLRRVKQVVSETYRGNTTYALPAGVSNNLDADWIPYMAKMGYQLTKEKQGWRHEVDAWFDRID